LRGEERKEDRKARAPHEPNDQKWRYLLTSSINFSCKISLARPSRAYQPSDFTAENTKNGNRENTFEEENVKIYSLADTNILNQPPFKNHTA
jgi:hypothetical protein